jgi:hypothetical protein
MYQALPHRWLAALAILISGAASAQSGTPPAPPMEMNMDMHKQMHEQMHNKMHKDMPMTMDHGKGTDMDHGKDMPMHMHQHASAPAPAAAASQAAPGAPRSAMEGYQPFASTGPKPWKESNEAVRQPGAAPAAEAAVPGAPAAANPPAADPHAGHKH